MITNKKLISKAGLFKIFLKIKRRMIIQSRMTYRFAKFRYRQLNKRQRIVLFSCISIIALLLISLSFIPSPAKTKKIKTAKLNTNYSVFEKKAIKPVNTVAAKNAPNLKNLKNISSTNDINALDNNTRLQAQFDQLKSLSNLQFKRVQNKLQSLQSNMSSLASQQDVRALQQSVAAPNKALLGKVDHLQNSVQTIIKQTAKKTWVNSKTVEQYFRLVAIQGFSDGMRAIIDVDGNQTVLSSREICPVCRGWILQSMDFTNQNAVFAKTTNNKHLYVKLQAN